MYIHTYMYIYTYIYIYIHLHIYIYPGHMRVPRSKYPLSSTIGLCKASLAELIQGFSTYIKTRYGLGIQVDFLYWSTQNPN